MKVQSDLHLCRQNIKQVARVCLPLRGLDQRDRQIVGVIPILLSKKVNREWTTWNAAFSEFSLLFPSILLLFLAFYYFFSFYYSYSYGPYLLSLWPWGERVHCVLSGDLNSDLRDLCFANLGGSFFVRCLRWCVYLGEILTAFGKDLKSVCTSGVTAFRIRRTRRL